MSATNVITTSDAVYLFSDGANYLGDGTLGFVSQKVTILAHLNAALSCRGPVAFMDALAPVINRTFSSFDNLVAGIVPLAAASFAAQSEALSVCQIGADFDLFVTGYSESRDRPEAYVLCSHDTNVEPWVLHELGPVALSPFDDALAERLAAMQAGDDVLDIGLAVMEAQRALRGQHAGSGPAAAGVGGHCQMTKVTREAIHTAIVRRWPDVVGERLGQELLAA